MFHILNRGATLCDGVTRRQLLGVGGLSLLGLTLPNLLAAREQPFDHALSNDPTFGRAKNVIFLYLAGGPPQHETFDPKPDAPVEIRGPFKPISTNVPGIQFCELLPSTARLADKLAVVRSMATDDNTHSSSSYWVLTGYKYQGPNPRTIQPTDRPYFGSLIKKFKPSEVLPPLSTVWIPDMMRLNENVTPAGQTGGVLGGQWDPDRFIGDPSSPDYEVAKLWESDLPPLRLARRKTLLSQIERHFDAARRGQAMAQHQAHRRQAFDLLTSEHAQKAFDLSHEPAKVRERYGKNRWGQCVLLARRLVEAGVRLVHVQWPREPGDNAVDNPLWDTHAQNADRVEDVLCPQFDVGFSALVEDLDQRGLLDETLVVAIGEFGRTPKINANGGRDHWGPVFSFAMAGAGVSGAQVYGASDKHGAYPLVDRVEPGDLTAAIYHLLGMDYRRTYYDRQGREHRATDGQPIKKLLGVSPATTERRQPTGDIARVPPFDENLRLRDTEFTTSTQILTAEAPSRPKGWRATPLLVDADKHGFGVKLLTSGAAMGLHGVSGETLNAVNKGQLALLAQEVRSPFAGVYTFRVWAKGIATDENFFEKIFTKHFQMKLIFFQYMEASKKPLARKEFAAQIISPPLEKEGVFELTKEFINPTPGANFSFGLGLGVAALIEKVSHEPIDLSKLALSGPQSALASINRVELVFRGKPRNEDVKV